MSWITKLAKDTDDWQYLGDLYCQSVSHTAGLNSGQSVNNFRDPCVSQHCVYRVSETSRNQTDSFGSIFFSGQSHFREVFISDSTQKSSLFVGHLFSLQANRRFVYFFSPCCYTQYQELNSQKNRLCVSPETHKSSSPTDKTWLAVPRDALRHISPIASATANKH